MKTIILVGGPNDARTYHVEYWQKILHVPSIITSSEQQDLKIDDVQSWKWPQDVYEKINENEFEYRKTIQYNPNHKSYDG